MRNWGGLARLAGAAGLAAAIAGAAHAQSFTGFYLGVHGGAGSQDIQGRDDQRFCSVNGVGVGCSFTLSSVTTTSDLTFIDDDRETSSGAGDVPDSGDPVSTLSVVTEATATARSVELEGAVSASTEPDASPALDSFASASTDFSASLTESEASISASATANTETTSATRAGSVSTTAPANVSESDDDLDVMDESEAAVAGNSNADGAFFTSEATATDDGSARSAETFVATSGTLSATALSVSASSRFSNADAPNGSSTSTIDLDGGEGVGTSRTFVDLNGAFSDASGAVGALGLADDLDAIDGLFGGHVGYDHQFDSGFVIGVSVDGSAAFGSDTEISGDGRRLSETIEVDLEFLGSARARIGYAFQLDSDGAEPMAAMPFVFGGGSFAYYDIDVSRTLDDQTTATGSFEESVFGGVVGGGLALLTSENVMVTIEGGYHFLDDEVETPLAAGGFSSDRTIEIDGVLETRFAISWRLN